MQRLLGVENFEQVQSNGVLKGRHDSAKVHLHSRPQERVKRERAWSEELQISGKLFRTKDGSFFVGVAEPFLEDVSFSHPHPDDNSFPLPHPNFKVIGALNWVCTLDMKMVRADPR